MKLYQCLACFKAYHLDLAKWFQRSCKPVRSTCKRTCECGQPASRVRVLARLKEGQKPVRVQAASRPDAETESGLCVVCGHAGHRRHAVNGGVLTRWAYCQNCWNAHLQKRNAVVNNALVELNQGLPEGETAYLTGKGRGQLDLLYTQREEGKVEK